MKKYNILITLHDEEGGDSKLLTDTYSIDKAIADLQKLKEAAWADSIFYPPKGSVSLHENEDDENTTLIETLPGYL